MMNCLLCKSTEITEIWSITTVRLIMEWRKSYRVDVSDQLRGVDEIRLYSCSICHLKFYSPSTLVGSGEFYEKLSKFNWYYFEEKWEFEQALYDLRGIDQVLEIGSGSGSFLKKAKAENFDIQGLEINENAVIDAASKGVRVKVGSIFDHEIGPQVSYGAICSFQVLEHLSNPLEFLVRSCDLLGKGGLLILSVPNEDSFIQYEHSLLNSPPHHITRWSVDSMKYIQKILPLKITSIKYEPLALYHVDYFVGNYLSKLSQLTRLPFIRKNLFRKTISWLLMTSRIYKFFTGHTLYVCFEKID